MTERLLLCVAGMLLLPGAWGSSQDWERDISQDQAVFGLSSNWDAIEPQQEIRRNRQSWWEPEPEPGDSGPALDVERSAGPAPAGRQRIAKQVVTIDVSRGGGEEPGGAESKTPAAGSSAGEAGKGRASGGSEIVVGYGRSPTQGEDSAGPSSAQSAGERGPSQPGEGALNKGSDVRMEIKTGPASGSGSAGQSSPSGSHPPAAAQQDQESAMGYQRPPTTGQAINVETDLKMEPGAGAGSAGQSSPSGGHQPPAGQQGQAPASANQRPPTNEKEIDIDLKMEPGPGTGSPGQSSPSGGHQPPASQQDQAPASGYQRPPTNEKEIDVETDLKMEPGAGAGSAGQSSSSGGHQPPAGQQGQEPASDQRPPTNEKKIDVETDLKMEPAAGTGSPGQSSSSGGHQPPAGQQGQAPASANHRPPMNEKKIDIDLKMEPGAGAGSAGQSSPTGGIQPPAVQQGQEPASDQRPPTNEKKIDIETDLKLEPASGAGSPGQSSSSSGHKPPAGQQGQVPPTNEKEIDINLKMEPASGAGSAGKSSPSGEHRPPGQRAARGYQRLPATEHHGSREAKSANDQRGSAGKITEKIDIKTDIKTGQAAAGAGNGSAGQSESIPGRPQVDYPILSTLPQSGFDCKSQSADGFYADTSKEARCQAFWVCHSNQQDGFLCPNGTLFNQRYFNCDWWFNVHCDESERYFELNKNIGVVGTRPGSQLMPSPSQPPSSDRPTVTLLSDILQYPRIPPMLIQDSSSESEPGHSAPQAALPSSNAPSKSEPVHSASQPALPSHNQDPDNDPVSVSSAVSVKGGVPGTPPDEKNSPAQPSQSPTGAQGKPAPPQGKLAPQKGKPEPQQEKIKMEIEFTSAKKHKSKRHLDATNVHRKHRKRSTKKSRVRALHHRKVREPPMVQSIDKIAFPVDVKGPNLPKIEEDFVVQQSGGNQKSTSIKDIMPSRFPKPGSVKVIAANAKEVQSPSAQSGQSNPSATAESQFPDLSSSSNNNTSDKYAGLTLSENIQIDQSGSGGKSTSEQKTEGMPGGQDSGNTAVTQNESQNSQDNSPSSDTAQPSGVADNSASGGDNSAAGGDNSAAGGDNSAAGGDNSAAGGDTSGQGSQQPAPSAGGAGNESNENKQTEMPEHQPQGGGQQNSDKMTIDEQIQFKSRQKPGDPSSSMTSSNQSQGSPAGQGDQKYGNSPDNSEQFIEEKSNINIMIPAQSETESDRNSSAGSNTTALPSSTTSAPPQNGDQQPGSPSGDKQSATGSEEQANITAASGTRTKEGSSEIVEQIDTKSEFTNRDGPHPETFKSDIRMEEHKLGSKPGVSDIEDPSALKREMPSETITSLQQQQQQGKAPPLGEIIPGRQNVQIKSESISRIIKNPSGRRSAISDPAGISLPELLRPPGFGSRYFQVRGGHKGTPTEAPLLANTPAPKPNPAVSHLQGSIDIKGKSGIAARSIDSMSAMAAQEDQSQLSSEVDSNGASSNNQQLMDLSERLPKLLSMVDGILGPSPFKSKREYEPSNRKDLVRETWEPGSSENRNQKRNSESEQRNSDSGINVTFFINDPSKRAIPGPNGLDAVNYPAPVHQQNKDEEIPSPRSLEQRDNRQTSYGLGQINYLTPMQQEKRDEEMSSVMSSEQSALGIKSNDFEVEKNIRAKARVKDNAPMKKLGVKKPTDVSYDYQYDELPSWMKSIARERRELAQNAKDPRLSRNQKDVRSPNVMSKMISRTGRQIHYVNHAPVKRRGVERPFNHAKRIRSTRKEWRDALKGLQEAPGAELDRLVERQARQPVINVRSQLEQLASSDDF